MTNRYPLTATLLFLGYTILSWVLFFRDERAINVIGQKFYPQLNSWLLATRETLLAWRLNTIPTLLFAIFLGISFFLYFKILKGKISVKTAMIGAICFQIIVLFSYPILSTDIFDYILSDRVATVYHQNVWITSSDQFKSDPYFNLADWTNKTKIYGGVNQIFYSAVAKFSPNDFVAKVASYKLLVLVFVILSIMVVAKTFPNYLVMIFWNPLFVLETIGSGHNDIIMLFFVLLGIIFFLRKKPLFVGLFLGLATQVKSTPLLLATFFALQYLGNKDLKSFAKFCLPYLLTIGAVYYFMGINPLDSFIRTASSINVYWQSLPMLINKFIPMANFFIPLGLIIFLGIQATRQLFFRKNPIEMYGQTLMVYLLFFLAAYWSWYPIWLLFVLPFFENSRLKKLFFALTFSSMLVYVTYWISLRLNYQLSIWPVIMYLTIISGPLAAYLYEKK